MRFTGLAVAVLALSFGCGTASEDPAVDGEWAGSVTTEGNVTTVVNESGSVWGGAATVVEELSIGVDAGEDPYMFGAASGLWMTDDAIYVADSRAPAVRVFDHQGRYLRDIGRVGQGPGEFERPFMVAVDDTGRVFVKEMGNTRVLVYTTEGEYIDTWAYPSTVRSGSGVMVVTHDGNVYIEQIEYSGFDADGFPDRDTRRQGMQAVGPDGKIGEMREEPSFPRTGELTYETERGLSGSSVPFFPFGTAAMARSGAWISGEGSSYRFKIEYPDGATTIVERDVPLVPILPDERESHLAHRLSSIRSRAPGWDWDGPPIPEHKPAFRRFLPGQEGQILVSRLGPGIRSDDESCVEFPTPQDFVDAREERRTITRCWTDSRIWDVFAEDGRFLGELDLPAARRYALVLRGRYLLTSEEDDAGTIRVKKYRLVLPGEESR